jgi:hypothetical protein
MVRNFIEYYAEPLGNGRAIMRCDIVVEDKLLLSYTVGSPAPETTVRQHEQKISLRPTTPEEGTQS